MDDRHDGAHTHTYSNNYELVGTPCTIVKNITNYEPWLSFLHFFDHQIVMVIISINSNLDTVTRQCCLVLYHTTP